MPVDAFSETPLATYVNADRQMLPATKSEPPVEGNLSLSFPSVVWRENEATPSQWTHHLSYTDPKALKECDLAVLFISNGQLGELVKPEQINPITEVRRDTGCWAARIDLVPNQGLTFLGDKEPRFEDGILAYGFAKYLKTLDVSWLANFAMAKSVSIAMDVLEDIYKKETKSALRGFILTGESKRGWTTWLTAAADRRVKGIIPMVIDFLNARQSLKYHHRRYGFWSPALKDYEKNGILNDLDTPALKKLWSEVDPFRYVADLQMPKLIINSANDQFFLPDSSQFYYAHLKGPKWLQYVPNVGHHITEKKPHYWRTLVAFIDALRLKSELPDVRIIRKQATYSLIATEPPKSATFYQAFNATKADFRFGKNFASYSALPIAFANKKFKLPKRRLDGWYAAFVEVEFASGARATSEVVIEKN